MTNGDSREGNGYSDGGRDRDPRDSGSPDGEVDKARFSCFLEMCG